MMGFATVGRAAAVLAVVAVAVGCSSGSQPEATPEPTPDLDTVAVEGVYDGTVVAGTTIEVRVSSLAPGVEVIACYATEAQLEELDPNRDTGPCGDLQRTGSLVGIASGAAAEDGVASVSLPSDAPPSSEAVRYALLVEWGVDGTLRSHQEWFEIVAGRENEPVP